MRWLIVAAALTAVAGCSKSGESASAKTKEAALTLVGVWPKDWTCDRIGTSDEIGTVLGAAARQIDGGMSTNDGLPKPCNYLVAGANGEEPWTFDIDCRANYKQTADAIMAQWVQASTDNVQRYNVESDAAPSEPPPKQPKPGAGSDTPDARPPGRAPEQAHEVAVGRKAVDVLGQGIIFVDDDAPCYVRIVGPDAAKRLALAQHVAQKLTMANAPMTPRAAE